MRNLKGFIFTVDAIFALIVAVAAVSVLMLSTYAPTFSNQEPASEAFSIAQALSQTTVAQAIQNGMPLLIAEGATGNSTQSIWPQYGGNASLSHSSPEIGPAFPLVSFKLKIDRSVVINPAIAIGDGIVVFTTNAPRSSLVILNETEGTEEYIVDAPGSTSFVGNPVVYDNMIYTFNAAGFVNAYDKRGNLLWWQQTGTVNAVLGSEDGYIVANTVIINPLNGTIVSNTAIAPTAFSNGEFITFASTSSSTSNLSTFALYGNTLTRIWTQTPAVTQAAVPPVSASGNAIVVGGGADLYVYNLGGSLLWSKVLLGDLESTAILYNGVYAKTTNALYGFNLTTGEEIFSTAINSTFTNSSIAVTPSYIYSLRNETFFDEFATGSGKLLWSLNLSYNSPVTFTTPVTIDTYAGGISVADGAAFFAVGNTLYSLSSCRADPSVSLLGDIARQYLFQRGGCADLLLNYTYPSTNIAIYVNNSYGPALRLAKFTGVNSFVALPSNATGAYTTQCKYTMLAWTYPGNVPLPGGIIALNPDGGTFNPSLPWANIQQSDTQVEYQLSDGSGGTVGNVVANGNFMDSWSMVALVLSGNEIYGYLNGNLTGTSTASDVGCISGITRGSIGYLQNGFNGSIAGVQFYNTSLSANQINALYREGLAALPITTANAVSWFPLDGDSSDYLHGYLGISINGSFVKYNFTPLSLLDSYQISRASVPKAILTSADNYGPYNIGVVIWR